MSAAPARQKKSTTGRSKKGPVWLRGGMGLLQAVAPDAAAMAASHLFFRTRRIRFDEAARALFDRAAPLLVPFGEQRLAAWSWGSGPTVVLSHGWNGNAAQLAAFVEPLLERGYRVVTFDHVGHGSSTGDSTSFPEMARATAAVVRAAGGAEAVIAHSLGAAALTLALHDREIDVSRVVLIGAPSSPLPWLGALGETLGLAGPVLARTKARIEHRAGRTLEELDVTALARGVDGVEALLMHDTRDRHVPVRSSRLIHHAWRESLLVTTRGLGHIRILKDEVVVSEAVGFVTR